ncbi:uncharacterized protein LOC125776326 [Bactrocera dorsalis]|uniref:Uncharacterized protein LOC125776326 n=1 Tax=Bactrocera dorsalis TaxID=27457 RepID=A0ABM3J475_BACDO|nr:uncharacterized protein LOC125776326 [Bactrocera dorsalis]XP_049304023.1 uncharacterized protein LOC125776326 [Bactrocera dorsalis]XP_049304024.1 uncharacterized protein LOC125776326 [Bactrocera dorsalis]
MASKNSSGCTPENPFRRNSKIMRTPPNGKNELSTAAGSTKKCEVATNTIRGGKHPEETLVNETTQNFIQLGSKIKELENMMAGQRHINQAMRDLVSSIVALHAKADKGGNLPKRIMVGKASQVSPMGKDVNTPKRLRETTGFLPPTKKPKNVNKAEQPTYSETLRLVQTNTTVIPTTSETWVDVVKKRRPAEKKIRSRPDAIILTKKDGASYADILRKIKCDTGLEELGSSVTYIRKTLKGDLLLELKSQADKRAETFQSALEEVVGEMAVIQPKTHNVTIICKDLDEITTPEEICEALKKECGIENLGKVNVKNMRKTRSGTQIATLCLRAQDAKAALKVGKIKIGWSICRLREYSPIPRCFRCFHLGHMAHKCSNPVDRSSLCTRCGAGGHVAKSCTNDPSCMLCKGAHSALSTTCPKYLEMAKSLGK